MHCHKYRQILIYIQIFILLKADFLLKEIQQSTIWINYKPNEQNIVSQNRYFKQGRYFDETNEKSGHYCK